MIEEICVFCHTPHKATKGVPGLANAPLWNRTNTSAAYTYQPYTSPTLSVSPSVTPTGTSMMCMSCHDGVSSIAVGTLMNAPGHGNPTVTPNGIASPGAIGSIYQGTLFTGWGPNLGENYPGMAGNVFINLSNDHPISFDWPAGGIAGQIYSTPQSTRLRLFGVNNRMECATCHQVHDPANVPFLAMSNSGSAMCVACHIK